MKPQEINFERIAVQAVFPGEEVNLNGQDFVVPEGEQLYLAIGDSENVSDMRYVIINEEQLSKYSDTGRVIPDGKLFWSIMKRKV